MTDDLRLAVDGRVLDDRYHGIGRCTAALLAEFSREPGLDVVVLVRGDQESSRFPLAEHIEGNGFVRARFDHAVTSPLQWAAWPRALARTGADVALFPYHLGAPLGSRRARRRRFSVVHDCILEADPAFAPDRRTRLLYPVLTRLAVAGTTVLTPSRASAAAIEERYGVRVDPAHVVPWGVARAFEAQGDGSPSSSLELPGRYLLHVGARRPHKNVEVAVRALAHLDEDVHLVLVGSPDDRWRDDLTRVAADLQVSHRVREFQGVSEADLRAVYAGASAFVYPSLVEGFGLPLLEAMASGVPVVASDIPVFREVGGEAVEYFAATSADALASAVRALDVPGRRDALVAAGRERAAAATWAASAAGVLAALRTAVRPVIPAPRPRQPRPARPTPAPPPPG